MIADPHVNAPSEAAATPPEDDAENAIAQGRPEASLIYARID